MNPNDDDAIVTLWHVQTMRYENAVCLMPRKNMGMITAGERTPNP